MRAWVRPGGAGSRPNRDRGSTRRPHPPVHDNPRPFGSRTPIRGQHGTAGGLHAIALAARLPQGPVPSILAVQHLVRAVPDQPPVFEEQHPIGKPDGLRVVRHEETGAAVHESPQAVPDELQRLSVELRGGFVQDQQLGPAQEQPRKRDGCQYAAEMHQLFGHCGIGVEAAQAGIGDKEDLCWERPRWHS